ncbi:MAG: ABC transporter permease [Clostridium sp.]|jgi:NitT/TauT family transport system permease protein|nr:ABC transporter permease [Clostridium sp.]
MRETRQEPKRELKRKPEREREQKTELTKQEEFVQKHRKQRQQVTSCRILLFVCFLILWETSAAFGWIDSFFFSSPSRVAKCFWKLCRDGSLFLHIGITLWETILSFLLVLSISLIVAALLWYCKKLSEILEPYLVMLNSLPKSALAPLFIVWLGTGTATIITAGVSVALFGSIISVYTGFRQMDPEKITLIYTLGGTKKTAFRKAILPGSVPVLLSTAKVNIGLALVGVIIGEFLAARKGLGYLIIYGSQVFQLDMVITSIILLCVIAMAFYKGIQHVEHRMKQRMGQ